MATRRQPLPTLTSLRFAAATWVLLLHAGSLASAAPLWLAFRSTGYLGVSFFFVLSGFVLTWSRSADRGTARFYWLRFARVWPMHALTTLVAVAMPGIWYPPDAVGVVEILTGVHAWDPRSHVHYGLNGVSWSLSCEAFFYLLFPLLVRPLEQLTRRGLAVVATLVMTALLLLPALTTGTADGATRDDPQWLWFNLPAYRLGEFVVGVLAGVAVSRGWRPRAGLLGPTLAVAGFVAVPTVGRLIGHDLARQFATWPLVPCFALLIASAARRDLAGRSGWLGGRVAVFLGESSFALYLVHQLVLHVWLTAGLGTHPSWAGFGLYLAAAVATAAAFHLAVEKPVERWLRARPVGLRRPGAHRREPAPWTVAPTPGAPADRDRDSAAGALT